MKSIFGGEYMYWTQYMCIMKCAISVVNKIDEEQWKEKRMGTKKRRLTIISKNRAPTEEKLENCHAKSCERRKWSDCSH